MVSVARRIRYHGRHRASRSLFGSVAQLLPLTNIIESLAGIPGLRTRAAQFPLWPLANHRPGLERPLISSTYFGLSVLLVVQHIASVEQMPGPLPIASAADVASAWGAGGNTLPRYAELPPLPSPPAVISGGKRESEPPVHQVAGTPEPPRALRGIPATVLSAYRQAADDLEVSRPACRMSVPLLAAIGRVESGHAYGGNVDAHGTTRTRILGPRLDGGPGVAAIRDTDGGTHDGDTLWDRAVGPMQFIPSTWRTWSIDGNSDGAADPNNVFDAAFAAGRYLCAAGGNVAGPDGLRRAVLAYNHSERYLQVVLAWMRVYAAGTVTVPDAHAAKPVSPARSNGPAKAEAAPPRQAAPPARQAAPPQREAGGSRPPLENHADRPSGRPPSPSPTPTSPPRDDGDALPETDELVSVPTLPVQGNAITP